MKYLFLFTIIIQGLFVFSQSLALDSIDTRGISGFQAQYRTALLKVKRVTQKGDTIYKTGCGFILKNRYVATCYHVFESNNEKAIEVKVLYNNEYLMMPEKIKYDSTYATLDYKSKKNQYNFKTHIYNEKDLRTDFIVLKLDKIIKTVPIKIDTILPRQRNEFDKIVASGYSNISNGDVNTNKFRFESSYQDLLGLEKMEDAIYMYSVGFARPGFSGSPCFNKEGAIISMIQTKIVDHIQLIKNLLEMHFLNQIQYDDLINQFSKDKEMGIATAISMKYLVDRYLKGYLLSIIIIKDSYC